MTIAGGILIFYYIYVFFRYHNLKNIFKTFLACGIGIKLFFNVGYVFKISHIEIIFFEWALYIIYLITIVFILKFGLTRKQWLGLLGILLFIIINNILLIIFPYDKPTVFYPYVWSDYIKFEQRIHLYYTRYVLIYDIYLLMFPMVCFTAVNVLKKQDIKDILLQIFNLGKVMLLFNCVEFIIKIFVSQSFFASIRNFIFGSTSDTIQELVRNGIPCIYGLNREPSEYALALFCWLMLALLIFNKPHTFKWILLASILGLLSGSFTFIICLFMVAILLFISNNKYLKQKIIIVFITLCIMGIFLITNKSLQAVIGGYFERIKLSINVLFYQDTTYSSEYTRIGSLIENMKIFIHRPLFGIGIGTSYAFSTIASLLANMGVIGLSILLYIYKVASGRKHTLQDLTWILPIIIILIITGNGISMMLFFEAILFIFINRLLINKKKERIRS